MRLSEAIRLGAMLKPQTTGALLSFDGRTCALGAACDAVGTKMRAGQIGLNNATFRRWPVLRLRVPSPEHDRFRVGLASVSVIIQSLNDFGRWTREEIADWVASVEAAQGMEEPASVAAIDPVVVAVQRA